ncbi:sulfurtransferase TusA family protein [Colwellia sp. TT2012]|uniref:sulfurtransferase TusA family protein n=1 Tax=Colwellia sp. TT2012 TaxID=1720342 RepID=UPI00070E5F72|nr:sulfurtransferase TusA family protein [Colwellia sp. TT2012]
MIYKYDGIGEKCPLPLINMRLLLKKMHVGDECIISINDVGSLNDIPKLLDKQGYQHSKKNLGNGTVEIRISI